MTMNDHPSFQGWLVIRMLALTMINQHMCQMWYSYLQWLRKYEKRCKM